MKKLLRLSELLNNTLSPGVHDWLTSQKQHLKHSTNDIETVASTLVLAFGKAKQKQTLLPLKGQINAGFKVDAYDQCNVLYLENWSVYDAIRILLLSEAIEYKQFAAGELFQHCYRYCDDGEKASLIKGLALMDVSNKMVDFVIDISRTNSLELFSALVYKNPWPAIYFPQQAFNKLILKALFMDLNILSIEGLRAKRNPYLGQMVADYAEEQLNAKRDIPASLWLAAIADLLPSHSLSVWENSLQLNPEKDPYQLAILGCEWQKNLPLSLKKVVNATIKTT